MDYVIVSRHPAAVEFIRLAAAEYFPEFVDAPVLPRASADDVRGKTVAGNIPLRMAAACDSVWAVEFRHSVPKNAEYTLEEMARAGARMTWYRVRTMDAALEDNARLRERWAAARGKTCGPQK